MSRDTSRPDKLARQMFFLGLLGLPWLWVVNILYFFDRVYGRILCFGAASEDMNGATDNGTSILGLISSEDEDEPENEETDAPSQEIIQNELSKWVKRSTVGSFISSAIFVTWIVVFQLNKDSFGPGWFVYSPSSEILTGW